MRTYNDNTSISNFEAWSGAVSTQDAIINAGKADAFDSLIEELYPDGLSETQLNDILWFDSDWIFESLGIDPEEDATEEEDEEEDQDEEE